MNISYQLIKRLGLKKSLEQENALLIFGDPRSGSTWLAELLCKATGRIMVDEPLNLNFSKSLELIDFGWRQDIPKNQEWPEAKDYFSSILNGSAVPSNCLQNNNLITFLRSDTAIYKIIRGKRLIHWLKANFQFHNKPIYLIRNPLAMIHSLSKHSSWNHEFTPYQLPKTRNIEVYEKHFTFLKSLQSKEELILSHWCIANESYFRNDPIMDKMILVKYEDLLVNPQEEIARILNQCGIKNKLDQIEWRKPSSSSNEKTLIHPELQLSKWKKEMPLDNQRKYNQVLDYFEVTYN